MTPHLGGVVSIFLQLLDHLLRAQKHKRWHTLHCAHSSSARDWLCCASFRSPDSGGVRAFVRGCHRYALGPIQVQTVKSTVSASEIRLFSAALAWWRACDKDCRTFKRSVAFSASSSQSTRSIVTTHSTAARSSSPQIRHIFQLSAKPSITRTDETSLTATCCSVKLDVIQCAECGENASKIFTASVLFHALGECAHL